MSTRQIPGAPYDQNARVVVRTDVSCTLDQNTSVIAVEASGVTVKMPDGGGPKGRRYLILATGGDVILDGNGFPILGGGGFVPNGSARELTLSPTNEWVPTLGSSSTFELKNPVRVILLAPIPLTGLPNVDGVALAAGDRVLRAVGTDTANGIYVVSAGPWTRAIDMPAGSSAAGALVVVEEGTLFADTAWLCTTDPPNDIVGANPITFVEFLLATTKPLNVTKSPALVGVSTQAARADHKHDISTASAIALTVGGGSSEGTATTLARSDHTHDVTTAVPVAVGIVNAEGVSTALSRADHVHAAGVASTNKYLHKSATVLPADFTTTAIGFAAVTGLLAAITPDAATDLNYYASVPFQVTETAGPSTLNVHARINDPLAGFVSTGSVDIVMPAGASSRRGMLTLVGIRVAQGPPVHNVQVEIGVSGSLTCSVDMFVADNPTILVENVLP